MHQPQPEADTETFDLLEEISCIVRVKVANAVEQLVESWEIMICGRNAVASRSSGSDLKIRARR